MRLWSKLLVNKSYPKIIYMTPEKLARSPTAMNLVETLYTAKVLERFVIDEVHWVSQWGRDWRSDYLNLNILKKHFPTVPILGLTATATRKVKKDIQKWLNIKDIIIFQNSFDRPNLFYEIRPKNSKTFINDIAYYVNQNFVSKVRNLYYFI